MGWPVWLQEGPTVKPPNDVSAASVAGREGGGVLCLFKRARARGRPRRTLPRSRARKGYPAAPRSCAWRSSALLSMMSIVCLTTVTNASLVSDSHTTRKLLSKPRSCRCVRKKTTTGKSCGTFPHGNLFDYSRGNIWSRGPRDFYTVVEKPCGPQKTQDLVLKSSRSQNRVVRRAIAGAAARQSSVGPRGDVDRNAIEVSGA